MWTVAFSRYQPEGQREPQKRSGVPKPSRTPICFVTFKIIYQGQGHHENWTRKDLWNSE